MMRIGRFFHLPDDGANLSGGGSGGLDTSVLTGETQPVQQVQQVEQTQSVQPVQQTPQAVPVSIIDVSGNFSTNWRDALPAELRTEKTLENFKDLRGLASALVSTKRMVGQNSIPLPNEHSGETAWNEFYQKIGRPEKPEDYKFDRDERIPEALRDSAGITAFKQSAHNLGLTSKQVAGIMKMYDEQVVAEIGNASARADQQRQTNIAALKTEWGDHYDANLNQAVMALNVLDPNQELAKQIPPGNPAFIKLMAKVAPLIGGDAMVRPPNGDNGLNDVESQMVAIQNNPAYRDPMNPDNKRLRANYELLAQQRAKLRRVSE